MSGTSGPSSTASFASVVLIIALSWAMGFYVGYVAGGKGVAPEISPVPNKRETMTDRKLTGLLTDKEITDLCRWGMLSPWEERQKRVGKISYGVTSCGYDIRLGTRFRVFTPTRCTVIDPKSFDMDALVVHEGDYCLIPPNSYALAESVERFQMPDDVLGVAIGKSTYARCGLICNCTPIEPGWHGYLTIELANATPLPIKVYANEGIAQVLFFRTGDRPLDTYGRFGNYQGQIGVTLPVVREDTY